MENKETLLTSSDFEQIANELLENGNKLRFRAHGQSMSPFIQNGDILTITPTESANLKKYDIVFYLKDDRTPVVHRILGKIKKNKNTVFLIRGDRYITGLEQIPIENIRGKVILIERNNRKINPNRHIKKLTAAIWSKTQSLRWFIYRIRRKLGIR